jgi:hypothetical protein
VSPSLPTPPRLGFTVTETVRAPEPVGPDPFIAALAGFLRPSEQKSVDLHQKTG